MAKDYKWVIKGVDTEESDRIHIVRLTCSNFTGKAIVSIDGDEYDISVKPLGLKGTNQVFRIGECPAVLEFPKKGEPTVSVEGEKIERERKI